MDTVLLYAGNYVGLRLHNEANLVEAESRFLSLNNNLTLLWAKFVWNGYRNVGDVFVTKVSGSFMIRLDPEVDE